MEGVAHTCLAFDLTVTSARSRVKLPVSATSKRFFFLNACRYLCALFVSVTDGGEVLLLFSYFS